METACEAEGPRSRRALVIVAVGIINDAIGIAVDEDTFERRAILAIDLLIDVEAIGGIADRVRLAVIARSGRDATDLDLVPLLTDELSYLILVVSGVGGQLPVPIIGLDGTQRESELDTLVLERTDVAGNLVAEVRAGRN